jgi:hypothetical protein
MEGIHTQSRRVMGSNSDQDQTVELPLECYGRGVKTREKLLVLAQLHLDGKWSYVDSVPRELLITNPDGSKSSIKQEEVTESKKTLRIYDSPVGRNAGHLTHIKAKVTQWVNRMRNGHLPSHIAWVAYKHQLWPGLHYSLGMMTNNMEPAAKLFNDIDHKTFKILGILQNFTKGLRKLHTTFGGFGIFDLPTEQLISPVNMFFQHYHVSTKISKKLDAPLGYLQLQIGTPQSPFTLYYTR